MKNHYQTILCLRGLACAILALAQAGCGQKGALFSPLPIKPVVLAPAPANPASAASAPLKP